MFQFARFASTHLCIQCEMTLAGQVSYSDIVGSMLYYQLPHAFRRLTSFIACDRRGIHHITPVSSL